MYAFTRVISHVRTSHVRHIDALAKGVSERLEDSVQLVNFTIHVARMNEAYRTCARSLEGCV